VFVNIGLAVAAISLLILAHEFGHFVMAKMVGMRVEVFSVGFWKRVAGFTKGDTDYRISLLPLGGYVKVSGESPEDDRDEPYKFWSKSPGQRALFVAGGVAMNIILAVMLFVVAFSIGVPFVVAEVGEVIAGEPAWEAGLIAGDRIETFGEIQAPVFDDITRAVALGDGGRIPVRITRDSREIELIIEPRYDSDEGRRLIGVVPPRRTVVTGLVEVGGDEGRCPAREAGVRIGDRIVAVNGMPVATRSDLGVADGRPGGTVELTLERDGQTRTVTLTLEPLTRFLIGISGVTTEIQSVARGRAADRAGFKADDRILAVDGRSVGSWPAMEEAFEGAGPAASVTVERANGLVTIDTQLADETTRAEFLDSMYPAAGVVMTYVEEDGPAWEVGVRVGDQVTAVGGARVHTWEDILEEQARLGDQAYEIEWSRGEEVFKAKVQPREVTADGPGHMGVLLERYKVAVRRETPLGAVRRGWQNALGALREFLLTLRGLATRQVSPRNMGGIVLISYASYHAATEGLGRLLYLTAFISAAIGFLNLLPIPVLDGGHLLFLLIEKVRGRRVGERAMMIAQTIGFALLMLLVVYVTHNDILRLFRYL
jgi:regulator of sigma E protease